VQLTDTGDIRFIR